MEGARAQARGAGQQQQPGEAGHEADQREAEGCPAECGARHPRSVAINEHSEEWLRDGSEAGICEAHEPDRGEAQVEATDQERVEDRQDPGIAVDGQVAEHQRQQPPIAEEVPQRRCRPAKPSPIRCQCATDGSPSYSVIVTSTE